MNIISEDELIKYGTIISFADKAEALFSHQRLFWNLVKNNFCALEKIKTNKYEFDNTFISTQFNPSRIVSTSAKVDSSSIENRKCFLCQDNLPSEQKGILYKEEYLLLVNPYPIFKQHLTIPNLSHIPQTIESNFRKMLELAFDLKEKFFVFYNGPKCGASAPDHFHFQAGIKNSTPLEVYLNVLLTNGIKISNNRKLSQTIVSNKLFKFIALQSAEINELEEVFYKIIDKLKTLNNSSEEPLLNLICFYDKNRWNLIIIPRKKHRPTQYFYEDNSKLLISPASVDMMGLLITPREEDFKNITKQQIEDIYNQVMLTENELLATFN